MPSLSLQPDFLAFAVGSFLACAAALVVVHRRLEHGLSPARRVGWFAAWLVTVVLGWLFIHHLDSAERQSIHTRVQGMARTYARELELMGHHRIGPATPPNDPAYLAMIEAEKRWVHLNPDNVHDIYTVRKIQGTNVFVVNSETDYNHDGRYRPEDHEERIPIGKPLPSTRPESGLEEAFRGQPNFDPVPSRDAWGRWVSAYVPMRDSSGQINAVLGVDYSASQYEAEIRGARLTGIAFLAVLVVLVAGSSSLIAILQAGLQERHQSSVALQTAQGSAEKANAQLTEANRQLAEAARHTEITNQRLQEAISHAEAMARSAQAANLAKSQFLANMSHELRTPLNGIIGMTELLLKSRLGPDQRECAETVRSSGEALHSLLSDILDYSKLEAGRLSLRPSLFSITEAVEQVVGLFAATAAGNDVELVYTFAPEVEEQYLGDAFRIRQVLLNLVGNAVKFTPTGHVSIRISRVLHDPSTSLLRFDILDTGPGMDPEARERIFHAFSPSDSGQRPRSHGTGLGLALSRQLVELMDGEIGVDSAPGAGSRFWFTTRLVPSDSNAAAQAPAPLAGVHVIILDPNPVNRESLYLAASRWGARVDAISDSAAFEERLSFTSPGEKVACIVAHRPPVLDALNEIRKAAGRSRRIVLLTPDQAAKVGDQVASVGASRALRPCLHSQLLAHLLGAPERPAPASGAASTQPTPAPLSAPQLLSPSAARVLVVEDNPLNQKLADLQLARLGYKAVCAASGSEALKFLETGSFHCVLLDYELPGLSGPEIARLVRDRESAAPPLSPPRPRTRLVAMTARTRPGDREACLAAGMDAYISKPVRLDELQLAIDPA